jgi:hypothetical protein
MNGDAVFLDYVYYIKSSTIFLTKKVALDLEWLFFIVIGVAIGFFQPTRLEEMAALAIALAMLAVMVVTALFVVVLVLNALALFIFYLHPKVRKRMKIGMAKRNMVGDVEKYSLLVNEISKTNRMYKNQEINIRQHEGLIKRCLPEMERIVKELPEFEEQGEVV